MGITIQQVCICQLFFVYCSKIQYIMNKYANLNKVVKESHSYAGCLKQLGIKVAGGNYSTLKNKIKEQQLDVSHFRGQGWNVGLKHKPNPAMPLSEIMVEYSTYQSNKLKIRLFNENIKEKRCECCNLTEWLSNPIPLELHHINGSKTDHRLENLQIVCPNCHAQTDNYRGKNINLSAQEEIPDVESVKFGETLTSNVDGNPELSLVEI